MFKHMKGFDPHGLSASKKVGGAGKRLEIMGGKKGAELSARKGEVERSGSGGAKVSFPGKRRGGLRPGSMS